MWIHYWISSGRQIDNVTAKSSWIKLRIAVGGSPFANYYNSKRLQPFVGRSAWEQNRKPLKGLIVNAGGSCFVLPFADTLITICMKQRIGAGMLLKWISQCYSPMLFFFTWTQTFIAGTSVSCSSGCLGQKWMNDFRRYVLENFLIAQILEECPPFTVSWDSLHF